MTGCERHRPLEVVSLDYGHEEGEVVWAASMRERERGVALERGRAAVGDGAWAVALEAADASEAAMAASTLETTSALGLLARAAGKRCARPAACPPARVGLGKKCHPERPQLNARTGLPVPLYSACGPSAWLVLAKMSPERPLNKCRTGPPRSLDVGSRRLVPRHGWCLAKNVNLNGPFEPYAWHRGLPPCHSLDMRVPSPSSLRKVVPGALGPGARLLGCHGIVASAPPCLVGW
ncbi:hypothetical protein ZIOFF_074748 [Zingiber officinale]|uniref:Uncharacterized protein n=1 Tax=Zingiber officinale TaxID=94328 RepID=A0A8J5BY23_ZINOF|nr:hypothetical protein ZIOFF_074748 [Zingiber officinale]